MTKLCGFCGLPYDDEAVFKRAWTPTGPSLACVECASDLHAARRERIAVALLQGLAASMPPLDLKKSVRELEFDGLIRHGAIGVAVSLTDALISLLDRKKP